MNTSSVLYYSRISNTILCILGLALSVYAVFVEWKKEVDRDYVAFCDINDVVACSKVFATKYARGFGLVAPLLGRDHILNQPNGVYGAVLYVILFVLSQLKKMKAAVFQRNLVFFANSATPYLAYLLYKVLKTFCVVCVATYIVNLLLLITAFWRMSALNEITSKRKKKSNKKE